MSISIYRVYGRRGDSRAVMFDWRKIPVKRLVSHKNCYHLVQRYRNFLRNNYILNTVETRAFKNRFPKKHYYRISLFFTPAIYFPVQLNHSFAVLTKQKTHIDVIRSPHIDKRSFEQFDAIHQKYVCHTKNIVPFAWLAKIVPQQTKDLSIRIAVKKKIRFFTPYFFKN